MIMQPWNLCVVGASNATAGPPRHSGTVVHYRTLIHRRAVRLPMGAEAHNILNAFVLTM